MKNFISNNWNDGFWGKAYLVFGVIVILFCVGYIISYLISNPHRRLRFIENATKEGNSVIAKLTCLTLNGINKAEYYNAEYMYFVGGKRYFVTYCINCDIMKDNDTENMNADMLLQNISCALLLFYDKKKPNRVLSKREIFASSDAIHQIHTYKNNVYRDVNKDWYEPIDLIMWTR